MNNNGIILISRDPDIALLCQKALEKETIPIQIIRDSEDALDVLSEGFSGAVILDSSRDEGDLPGLCRFIFGSLKIPVIVIGSKGIAETRIKYLESGADVYMELPFNTDELLAQVKALRRRTGSGEIHPDIADFASGDLRIDYHRRLVTVKGKEVRLRPREYELLRELTLNAGKTLSYSYLLHKIWGSDYQEERQYLHLYINYLRQKIEPDPRKPQYIVTVPKVGYVFKYT